MTNSWDSFSIKQRKNRSTAQTCYYSQILLGAAGTLLFVFICIYSLICRAKRNIIIFIRTMSTSLYRLAPPPVQRGVHDMMITFGSWEAKTNSLFKCLCFWKWFWTAVQPWKSWFTQSTVIMFCLVCSSLACCTAVTSANVSVTHPVQWEQLSLCLDFRQTRNYFTCGSGSSSLKLIAVKDAQSNASKKPARCRYNRKKQIWKPVLLYWS